MQNDFHHYFTYGLSFRSQIPLPGLLALDEGSDVTPDVDIFYSKITDDVIDQYFAGEPVYHAPGCDVRVNRNAICFQYHKGATLLISGGDQVMVDLNDDAVEDDLTPYLTGYVLAILLSQRNYLVLHASVVDVGGSVVAFLGAKGYGKSTLAASLQVKGHKLISDDCLPIIFDGDRILTYPGFPQIKLFADSVMAVGADPASLDSIHRSHSKFAFPCNEFRGDANSPLAAIYVLNIDDSMNIVRLGPAHAFIEATRHTHNNYYLKHFKRQELHFEQCQKLIASIPFFQLNRPHDFQKINGVTDMLEEHFRQV
jgi:hypothetical protein